MRSGLNRTGSIRSRLEGTKGSCSATDRVAALSEHTSRTHSVHLSEAEIIRPGFGRVVVKYDLEGPITRSRVVYVREGLLTLMREKELDGVRSRYVGFGCRIERSASSCDRTQPATRVRVQPIPSV